MAFLDNSGDIILDAVLTDLGRERLARGDGSFQIAKFAFGDDEVNYENYDPNDASGSAYYDLSILQAPVFEAFTDNGATMKSKLISIANPNLLYLPIIKANVLDLSAQQDTNNMYVIASSTDTEKVKTSASAGGIFVAGSNQGLIKGVSLPADANYIRADQGLDTIAIAPSVVLPNELQETQYSIEIDDRFGFIASPNSNTAANLSFVDDDFIATYIVNTTPYVTPNLLDIESQSDQVIAGPRGTILKFRIGAQMNLQQSSYYFDTFGTTATINSRTGVNVIDSVIRISGMTTGYSLDLTVRFAKV
jgi:hypothetical protein